MVEQNRQMASPHKSCIYESLLFRILSFRSDIKFKQHNKIATAIKFIRVRNFFLSTKDKIILEANVFFYNLYHYYVKFPQLSTGEICVSLTPCIRCISLSWLQQASRSTADSLYYELCSNDDVFQTRFRIDFRISVQNFLSSCLESHLKTLRMIMNILTILLVCAAVKSIMLTISSTKNKRLSTTKDTYSIQFFFELGI